MESKEMPFDIASNVSTALVIIGLTIFFVFIYLKKRSSFTHSLILQLYQLNRDVNHDVLLFLEQSWSILDKAGFQKIYGQVGWYGEEKGVFFGKEFNFATKRLFGTPKKYLVSIDEGDIKIDLTLVTKPNISGENKLIAEIIFQTFLVLLSSNTTSKNMQFVLSQERIERFQLFISHDVKNIAQFISLLKSQVKNSKSEKEKLALIERLDRLLPSLSEKAKKITSHMRYDKAFFDDVEQVCLLEKIKYYADANEISIELDQRASKISINLSQTLLQQVITEILNNFKVHADVTTIKIDVLEEDGVILIIFKAKRDVELHIESERLFEPFWTTSKSGMGLGLFVTREILKKNGGKIKFVQNKKELSFCVTLPHLCKGLPVIK